MNKALVTGDLGLVGRHIVEELKDRGWDVYGLDILDRQDAVEFFTDRHYCEYFDLVVHCAYLVGGRASIDGTNMNLSKNLILDSTMFEWAVRTHQSAIIYFSSSAAYPVQLQNPRNPSGATRLTEDDINLDDIMTPDSNYGWAKLTGERVAKTASDEGLRVHIVRPFSGYGPDQGLEYPFPSIIKRATKGDYSVWGPKNQTRDWIHISDVVRGSLSVYENDVREPVNLCTGVGTTMGDLMRMAVGEDVEIHYLEDKPTGVLYRVGDPTKMSTIYEPKISIEEGVNECIIHNPRNDRPVGH